MARKIVHDTIPKGIYPHGIARAQDKQIRDASAERVGQLRKHDTDTAKAAKQGRN